MISEKMEKAINKQINEEFYSSYIYLSMSAYFEDIGLSGFAHWMRTQAEEEHFHAMKFFAYLSERGGRIVLDKIEKPQIEWKSAIDAFEETLKHEQYITSCINKLMDLSLEERDHASNSFLQWFIDEQVEEEASVDEILGKLKLIGDKGNGIFMMDQNLAKRTFTPPSSEE